MARSFGTTGQPMHIYVSGESDLDESGSGSTGPESGSTVFEWTYTCDCSTAEQTTRGVQNHFFESTGEHGSRACYECSGPRCDTCTIVVPEGMSGAAIWGIIVSCVLAACAICCGCCALAYQFCKSKHAVNGCPAVAIDSTHTESNGGPPTAAYNTYFLPDLFFIIFKNL